MSGTIGQIGARSGIVGSTTDSTQLDYEEGTWTASITQTNGSNPMTMNASYQTGYYTKIGNLVTVTGYFITTSLGSASGDIRVNGLPFNSVNDNGAYTAVSIGAGGGLNLASAGYHVSGYLTLDVDYFNLSVWDGTAGTSAMTASEWTADGSIIMSFSYRTA